MICAGRRRCDQRSPLSRAVLDVRRVASLGRSWGRVATRTVIVLLLGALCLSGLAAILHRSWQIESGLEEERPRAAHPPLLIEAPPPPRPVPPGLQPVYLRIHSLQRTRKFVEVAVAYPAFLQKLERAWGQESEDLAGYYYDFCLALKLAGRADSARSVPS